MPKGITGRPAWRSFVEPLESRLQLASTIVVLVEPPTSTPYLREFTRDGLRGATFTLPTVSGGLNVGQVDVGDFTIGADRSIDLSVGGTNAKHLTYTGVGWAINPGYALPNAVEKGVLARVGNDVFFNVSGSLIRQTPDGVRTTFATGSWIDLSAGLDGKLYALRSGASMIDVYSPTTLTTLSQISLSEPANAIAVDASGTIFGGKNGFFRYNAAGALQQRHDLTQDLVTDLEVDTDGTIIAGSANYRWLLTDSTFSTVSAFSPSVDQADVRAVGFGDLPVSNLTQRFSFATRLDNDFSAALSTPDGFVPGVEVYLDLDNDGARDWREPNLFSNSNGSVGFSNIATGTYNVRAIPPTGMTQVLPVQNGALSSAGTSTAQMTFLFASQTNGAVQGVFFNDADGDGVRDTGEEPLNGSLTFSAYLDLNGNAIQDTADRVSSVGTDGSYAFYNVPAGTYKLYPVKADTSTGASWAATTPAPLNVTIQAGQVVTGLDVGYRQAYAVVARVVADYDFDGVQDSDESGLSSYHVYADLNQNSKWDADEPSATTANTTGEAKLSLPAGTYALRISNLTNTSSELTGRSMTVTVSGSQWVSSGIVRVPTDMAVPVNQKLTFHVAPPARVGGQVFNDLDGDGTLDTGEPFVSGIRVYLDANNNGIFDDSNWQTTAPEFSFPYLPVGTHTFRLNLGNGWRQTTPAGGHVVTLSRPGQSEWRYFGVQEVSVGTISGAVWEDTDGDGARETGEPALPGVFVYDDIDNNGALDTATEPYAIAAADGRYTIKDLLKGTHYIRQHPFVGYTRTAPSGNVYTVSLPTAANLTGYDFAQQKVPAPTSITLQSESATMSGGTVKASNNAGYTGTGFADYSGQGSAVTYTLTRTSAGTATLEFRYANGSTANRPLQVLVNNVVVGTVACAPTGAWTTWKTVSLANVALPSGTVSIKAVASTSAGGANVDSLTVTSAGTVTPPPVDPPPAGDLVIQAESATMSGGTVKASNNAGFAGTGFADYAGQGSAVTYSLTRTSAGGASLSFRYANGSTTNRPLQILVNDVVVGTVACAPTGAWTTWGTVTLTGINLPAGAVAIKAIASTSAGGANVDSLTVTGGGTVTPPPPPPPTGTKTGSISGVVWTETDADGKREAGESLLSGKQVFIDLDRDGVIDANETVVTTNSSGVYTFTGLAAGTYRVGRVKQVGYWFSSPKTGFWDITIADGEKRTGVDIGTANKPPV